MPTLLSYPTSLLVPNGLLFFLSSKLFFLPLLSPRLSFFFFFNDTAPPEIYPLPLHAALPISTCSPIRCRCATDLRQFRQSRDATAPAAIRHCSFPSSVTRSIGAVCGFGLQPIRLETVLDRKSTRLNSSHLGISYAVFCLKKKN